VSDLVGSKGGEAYGNHGLFLERTREIMTRLLAQLPDWLEAIAVERIHHQEHQERTPSTPSTPRDR